MPLLSDDSKVIFDEHAQSVLIGIEVSRVGYTKFIGPKVIFEAHVKACVGSMQLLAEVVFELRVDLQIFRIACLVGRKDPVD